MDIQDESDTFLTTCTVGSEQNGSTSMKGYNDTIGQLLDQIYDYGQVADRQRCSKVFFTYKNLKQGILTRLGCIILHSVHPNNILCPI